MDEAAWHGWMAVKIAAELALRQAGGGLEGAIFDGHKGMPLRFDGRDHHLVQPVYLIDAKGRLAGEVRPEERA
jgi:hypothetical protein